MTELEKFRQTFANKSKVTNNVYNSNYKKLREMLGDVDIASVSQQKVIELAETLNNRNSQQSLINIAYLIRKNEGMAIQELETFRKKNQSVTITLSFLLSAGGGERVCPRAHLHVLRPPTNILLKERNFISILGGIRRNRPIKGKTIGFIQRTRRRITLKEIARKTLFIADTG